MRVCKQNLPASDSVVALMFILLSSISLQAADVTINVDGASPIRTIPMTMYGTNLQSWDWHLDGDCIVDFYEFSKFAQNWMN